MFVVPAAGAFALLRMAGSKWEDRWCARREILMGIMIFGANPMTEAVISIPLRSGGLSFVPARRFGSGHESGLGFLNGWAKNLPQLEDDCEGLYDELD